MVNEQTCSTCRWWAERDSGNPWLSRAMKGARECWNEQLNATGIDRGGDESSMVTLPQFGCNQWEEKQSK